MSLWPLAATVVLFGLLGWLGSRFAAALAAPADGLLYRGVVYTMAGAVALHLVLTVLDFAGLRWSLPVLALAALGLVASGRGGSGRQGGGSTRPGWGDALAIFAVAVFTAFALSGWITMPDYIYHWGFKGLRFYQAQGVDYELLAHGWNWTIHPDYPNLVPELYAVTAKLARSFDMQAMMLGTTVLFALLVAACREGLRQGGADRYTVQAGTALVALSSAAFGIGYIMAGAADWNLALALAAAVPPLLRPPDRTGDCQIAVCAAFAAASKIEGVPLGAFLVAVQILRRFAAERALSLRAPLAAGLLPAAVVLPWLGRAAHYHLFQSFNSGAFELKRAGEIFAGVGEALQYPAWHGLLPVMFLPLLLVIPRRTRAFAVAASLELLFYFYVYFTSSVGSYRYFVLSNFPRLGFQLIPACLVAGLVASRMKSGAAKSKRPAGSPPPAAPLETTPDLSAAG